MAARPATVRKRCRSEMALDAAAQRELVQRMLERVSARDLRRFQRSICRAIAREKAKARASTPEPVQLALDLRPPREPRETRRRRPAPPSPERDRIAFTRLASGGPAERALHAAVSEHGLAATAADLEVEPEAVVRWIRAGSVPEGDAARLISQREPQRSRAARHTVARQRAEEVASLPVRQAARVLGVSHQTVLRWRKANEKHQ